MPLKSGGFGALSPRDIFTPASLAARLQADFDRDLGPVWVEGEISELSLPYSGHAYFSLKEKTRGQEAAVKAVMWKGRRPYAGGALSEGMSVLAKGRLAIYAPRGELQLVVDYLEPKGEGALRLAFEKLKARLEAEGLFAEERKRPLPYWPARVAVISSPSGAAVRDFLKSALRRRPGAAISLYPVRVQGGGAAPEIATALEDLNAWGTFDLIVLTRGGGSLSDLWPFNEEAVVRAVAASRTPTLAAIGHSTDLTLAELAADRRAITPTAAAETVFRDQLLLLEHLAGLEARLFRVANAALAGRKGRLEALLGRQARALINKYAGNRANLEALINRLGRFEDRLGRAGQRLDDLVRRLAPAAGAVLERRERPWRALADSLRHLSPQGLLAARRRDLAALEDELSRGLESRLSDSARRLELLLARLSALSPQGILDRGYALVSRASDSSPALRAGDLEKGELLDIRLRQGCLTAEVKDIL